jgi:hypothetical protein
MLQAALHAAGRGRRLEANLCAGPSQELPPQQLCTLRLLGLEAVIAAAEGIHDISDILLGVLLGILEVVIHDVVWIEAVLGRNLRLRRVVDDKELVGAVLLAEVHALRRERILDPELCGILMLAALEDGPWRLPHRMRRSSG